jgi:proton-translocating NADH-quinone oxidoreductase chain M
MSHFFQNPLIYIVGLLSFGFLFCQILEETKINVVRLFCLNISLAALFLGVLSCLAFNYSAVGFQFLLRLNVLPSDNLSFTLGADGLSMIFLLLTLFVFPVCFASSWAVTKKSKSFFTYLLAMELLLVITFTTLDLFYFYVFFESLLIPMFIFIGVWGARERKIKAAYLFFLYTLFGSLIMLFGVLYLYMITGSTNYFVILNTELDAEQQKLIWICFFMAFAVKMPLYPFHIWLPEAHVEAPTVGSMLLASLLLKLGGYGFLRFSLSMLHEGSVYFNSLVSTLALLGVVYGSLSTIRQIDLKRVIAYSSVAHMNLVMLGLFSFNQQGIEGATYLMVGHGVVSTALFFCVGVLYDRYHSRLLRYYGGLVTVMPLFSFFFFSFTLANMSFPGTSNFLGELLLFLGIFAQNSTTLLFSTAGIVLSAVYSVWLFNRVSFGTLKTTYISRFTDVTRRETAILITLLVPMLILGLSANFILEFLHFPVKTILLSSNTRHMLQ